MDVTPASLKLYTPLQIRFRSFLGGPIAAIYYLKENFSVLGNSAEARKTVFWGVAIVVGMMISIPFLPDRFPHYVIPLAYAYAAGAVAEKWQLGKQAIVDSGKYQFQSNWRVCGLALLLMIAFIGILFVEIFCLVQLGWMK